MTNSFWDMLSGGSQQQPEYGGLLGALGGQQPGQPPAFDLMSAGLAMMAASQGGQPGTGKPGLGQILSSGLQTGREQGQAAQDQAMRQAYVGMQMKQMQRAQQQQAAQDDARSKLYGGLDSRGIAWNTGRQGLTDPQQMQLYAQADPEGYLKLVQQQREWEMKAQYEPQIAGQIEAAKNKPLGERRQTEKAIDLAYNPQIAGATEAARNPYLIARAGGEANARNASDAAYAGPKAYQAAMGGARADLATVQVQGPDGQMVTMPLLQAKPYLQESGRIAAEAAQGAQWVTEAGPDGIQIQRNTRTGERKAAPRADFTQDAAKSAGFGNRMVQAEGKLGGITAAGTDGKPTLAEAWARGQPFVGNTLGNLAAGEQRQLYRQAQEDWVRAKLRKESGAVIGEEEMAAEIRMYFPQIGDGQEVIRQKEQARKIAIDSMLAESQGAYAALFGKQAVPRSQAVPQSTATPALPTLPSGFSIVR